MTQEQGSSVQRSHGSCWWPAIFLQVFPSDVSTRVSLKIQSACLVPRVRPTCRWWSSCGLNLGVGCARRSALDAGSTGCESSGSRTTGHVEAQLPSHTTAASSKRSLQSTLYSPRFSSLVSFKMKTFDSRCHPRLCEFRCAAQGSDICVT